MHHKTLVHTEDLALLACLPCLEQGQQCLPSLVLLRREWPHATEAHICKAYVGVHVQRIKRAGTAGTQDSNTYTTTAMRGPGGLSYTKLIVASSPGSVRHVPIQDRLGCSPRVNPSEVAHLAQVLRRLQRHLVEQHVHQGPEQDALGLRLLVRLPQAQPRFSLGLT